LARHADKNLSVSSIFGPDCSDNCRPALAIATVQAWRLEAENHVAIAAGLSRAWTDPQIGFCDVLAETDQNSELPLAPAKLRAAR